MKTKLFLFSAILFSFLSYSQEIDLKQGSNSYASGSIYSFINTQQNGITTVAFRVENLSAPNLLLTGTPRAELSGVDADQFLISSQPAASIANGSGSNFNIQFKPTSIGSKTATLTILNNDSDEGVYTIILNAEGIPSKNSTITITPGYTYTPTIPYMSHQASDITALTGYEIITFRINDPVNTTSVELDNLPTILTDITLSVSNSANIRSVAIYDGLDEIAEEPGAPLVTFNNIALSAPDGGTKEFRVLVTFNSTVTDNQNISIGITSATAAPTSSGFAAANAGGAVSSTSASNNKIEVIATALNFVQQPTDTNTFVAMNPSVTVEAVDFLGNRDLNYTSPVILTTTGSFHTTGTSPLNDANNNASAGLVSYPQLVHGIEGVAFTLTASSGMLTTATSEAFEINTASASNNRFRTVASGNWSDISTWETSGNNITWTPATLAPTPLSTIITIQSGHTVTCNTEENADQMTIANGGTLKIVAGGSLTIKNGTGTDLIVNGTLEHEGGLFTQDPGVLMSVGATGKYIHSIPTATLNLPRFTWATNSTCEITGLNNATPITTTNFDQTFSNLVWNNPNQMDFVIIDNTNFRVNRSLTLGSSANNKLCIAASIEHTNTITAVTINGGVLRGFAGTATGTLTATTIVINNGAFSGFSDASSGTINATTITINEGLFTGFSNTSSGTFNMTALNIPNGTFIANNSNGITNFNINGTTTIGTSGHFIASNNAGTANFLVNAVTLNGNGSLTLINSANSGNVTMNFAGTNRSLALNGTSTLALETVSSPGEAVINISNNFICNSTATPAVDFGTGDVTGNLISLKRNFTKTGNGLITTSSTTNAATGFVFSGDVQSINFGGTTPSSGVNYTANNTGTFTFISNFTFGTSPSTQKTIFTINAPTVNLGAVTLTGNATTAQFNIASGTNIITNHSAGLGGTAATGNFVNFASIGNTAADGRVNFGTNCNYTFLRSTSTPFPIGGTWTMPNNIIINGNTITSNYTTPFNLDGTLTINANRTFRLNNTPGAHLNLRNQLIIDGTFDANTGFNQIVDAGGNPSILLNNTFITRDADGFNGTNASIPTIPVTFGAGSIVNYAGASQIITDAPYGSLTISGTGTKTLQTNTITVNGTLNVTASLLRVEANKTLSVANKITTTATTNTKGIIVENNASLVQTNEPTEENAGDVRILRSTMPVYRNDYTYWSSPLTLSSSFSLFDLSPLTMSNKYMKWNHSANTQVWQVILNGNEDMVPGRGYIVRPPTTFNLEGAGAATVYNATFTGIPNNGTVTHAITGSTTTDKFNLLGNPYPSALDADAFLTQNAAVLEGTLYLWTHNSAYGSSSGYAYGNDYATYNLGTGGTATTGGDGNGGDNQNIPTGKIASGQSFFVKGIANGAGVATFNNSMRVLGSNDQFFRQNQQENIEKNRIWLNIKGETQGFNQTLVGYITDATNEKENGFDSESFGGNQLTFYSVLNTDKLVIQGRALPFSTQDTVPLGYKSTITGNLTISIDQVDGLFENQNIYLQDNTLNIVHDLTAGSYTFDTAIGTFDNRFVLRYTPQENLDNPTFDQQLKGITIRKKDSNIYIQSQHELIDQIYVYDIMGRLIYENKTTNSNSFNIPGMDAVKQTLIVKVVLKNGGVITQKVL
ncbi:T9SS sorting signal type C domain-containing protein [Flavobacterium sp.]|uniref:T9SS sorting signal type C domain-containing protein n=1 Tax=Flavobacterium sp. TaxID=239 RepID=UPI00263226EC|nr:T9SS sorting signal type C domain-containing protein [Flavobacterium sp.]MDD3003776.1 T9SS sorting signal type C domain-containing protein [Flavobacterium sp.]